MPTQIIIYADRILLTYQHTYFNYKNKPMQYSESHRLSLD